MNRIGTQPDLQKLLSSDFMGAHTKYPTMQALLDALANSYVGGHKLIKLWELDLFMRKKTQFASWSDMVGCAKLCYAKQVHLLYSGPSHD